VCASTRGNGVPDFGDGLRRERLVDLLHGLGGRPTVLVAPSGSGKSFLVSQFLRGREGAAIWIDAGGSVLEACELRDLVLSALGCRHTRSRRRSPESSPAECAATAADAVRRADVAGLCLVLDDFGGPGVAGDADGLSALAAALWRGGVRTIVTTRSVDGWPPQMRCTWAVVDEHDLALIDTEARAIARLGGAEDAKTDVEELRADVSGHVALFLAMLSQVRRYGSSDSKNRVVSLEAWLDRVVADMSTSELQAFRYACAVKTGTERQLMELGVDAPR
jgi:ATP/maltotriose-dependent transcriptional regulator MalT